MGVELCRLHALVAEQLLHRADIRIKDRGISLYLTEESGQLLLWGVWGDPDEWEFIKNEKIVSPRSYHRDLRLARFCPCEFAGDDFPPRVSGRRRALQRELPSCRRKGYDCRSVRGYSGFEAFYFRSSTQGSARSYRWKIGRRNDEGSI